MSDELERLIGRHLDGELSPDEELELNRVIIRNPEAHHTLEDYKRLDALCGAVLADAMGHECALDTRDLSEQNVSPRRRTYFRPWWLVIGAAAAMLLVVAFGPNSSDTLERPPGVTIDAPRVVDSTPVDDLPRVAKVDNPLLAGGSRNIEPLDLTLPGSHDGPARSVSTHRRPQHIRYDTLRDLTGVIGDDGKIYWFEIDRTRKTKSKPRDSGVRLVRGDL